MQVNMMGAGGQGVLDGFLLRTRREDGAATAQDPDTSPSLGVKIANARKQQAPSGLFSSAQSDNTSRYVQGLMTSLGVAEQMRNAAQAGGMTLLDEALGLAGLESASGAAAWESEYVDAIHKRHEAEKLARNEEDAKTVEASKRNLREVREDIDRAAEGETPGEPRTEADTAKETNGTEAVAEKNQDEEEQAGGQSEETVKDKDESLLEALHQVREERSMLTQAVATRAYAAGTETAGQSPVGSAQAEPGVDLTV